MSPRRIKLGTPLVHSSPLVSALVPPISDPYFVHKSPRRISSTPTAKKPTTQAAVELTGKATAELTGEATGVGRWVLVVVLEGRAPDVAEVDRLIQGRQRQRALEE